MELVSTARYSVFSNRHEQDDLLAAKWKSKWLSDRLYAATGGSTNIDFNSAIVQEVLEPHLQVCRDQRREVLAAKLAGSSVTLSQVKSILGGVTGEEILCYDIKRWSLRQLLTKALFGDNRDDIKLEQLHRVYQGSGKKNDRAEKRSLAKPLTIPERRAIFQEGDGGGFDSFVLEFILPSLERQLPAEEEFFYQAFPCVRIVRPGEFSIGVHADCNYGFSPAAVNFYVALTDVYGTNSIAVESEPEKEDFRVADLKWEHGDVYRFHGSVCAHFTMENTTPTTRVSLDFRVIAGSLWEGDKACADHYSKSKGYFVSAKKMTLNGATQWARSEPLPEPDVRNGFPFTKQ